MSARVLAPAAQPMREETLEDLICAQAEFAEDVQLYKMFQMLMQSIERNEVLRNLELLQIRHFPNESEMLDALTEISLSLYDPRYMGRRGDPLAPLTEMQLPSLNEDLEMAPEENEVISDNGKQLAAYFNQYSKLLLVRINEMNLGDAGCRKIIDAHANVSGFLAEYIAQYEVIEA